MKTPLDKTQESQQETVQRLVHEPSTGGAAVIVDNRPATVIQGKLRARLESTGFNTNPIQRKTYPERSRKNNTGLPDHLKSGIENLSGYSMDDVKVHYNSSKPAQLQAHAYAQGTHIHLGPRQEKHLPHEAWHVVQQKQGRVQPTRQLKSRVPINDDTSLEREADVMGEKALGMQNEQKNSSVLTTHAHQGDTFTSAYHPVQRIASDKKIVQRVIKIGEKNKPETQEKLDKIKDVWPIVETFQPIQDLEVDEKVQAKNILKKWMKAPAKSNIYLRTSENRLYGSYGELARALAGEVKSAENLAQENALSREVQQSEYINEGVTAFMTRLKEWHEDIISDNDNEKIKNAATNVRGRYRTYYGTLQIQYLFSQGTTIQEAINKLPKSLNKSVAIAADYAMFIRKRVSGWSPQMGPHLNKARTNHWNPNEEADWTKEAREHQVPLSAGPSATTALVMELGRIIGATTAEKEAMAWGLFSFFNQRLNKNVSGTHRFHEVMVVAQAYGVPYTEWVTSELPEQTNL
ncbi:hypothetical protein GCM10009430_02930 [Aquimarina litoralis]|uniref:eCIS core domain-containing protein n=1 Tax=Aquimarina litoralis TaxID=584605 RepID=A0ABP3TM51_9FLAO